MIENAELEDQARRIMAYFETQEFPQSLKIMKLLLAEIEAKELKIKELEDKISNK